MVHQSESHIVAKPLGGQDAQGPDKDHPYKRKMLGCPCPAIAVMINHSYLKVENAEEKIPIQKLMLALVECYNLSWIFAIVFAIVGTLRLGKIFGFNIRELGEHGKIEHDASLSRFDADKGNSLDPDHELINELFDSIETVDESKTKVVTLEEFAKKKWELEKQLTRFDFQSKSEINFLGRGEVSLALQAHRVLNSDSNILNSQGSIGPIANAQWLRVWFSEERLPVELGWKKPTSKITLLGTFSLMRKMKTIQKSFSTYFGNDQS